MRVHLTWWGIHRTLNARQKEEVGVTYDADARFLTAGKKLNDTRHEAFRRLTSLRTRVSNYWRGLTLPYVEAGVRLAARPADGSGGLTLPATRSSDATGFEVSFQLRDPLCDVL